MKYFFAVLFVLLIAGCTKKSTIEFTGTTPGITDGEFMIKAISTDAVICKTQIKAGKFAISQEWKEAGYYYMAIDSKAYGQSVFDVYLEPGTYTITTNKDQPFVYPEIRSSSERQMQLAEYYHLSDTINNPIHKKVSDLSAQMNDPKTKVLPPAAYAELDNNLKAARLEESHSGSNALAAFVSKYPDSEVGMHILVNIDYQSDPAAYYNIFKKMAPALRNSDKGRQIGEYLANNSGKIVKPHFKD
jgi:hypothetical protein